MDSRTRWASTASASTCSTSGRRSARLATRHPECVQGLILQNGNAYEEGLGPSMQALKPYWQDRMTNEAAIRRVLTLDATRSQYLDGVADVTTVDPDLWELDQRYLELPGRDRVMLDLLHDYQSNVELYPRARAYLADLPEAELHLLDTGHFATATHPDEIAELIAEFLDRRFAGGRVTAAQALR